MTYLRARLRAHRTTERGFTLVELGVGVILTVILLGIVLGVMSTFFNVETGNDSTYTELDQLIPVGTAFQQLLRTAVAPATGGPGKPPVPPFGTFSPASPYGPTLLPPATLITHTSLTFFSNTGTQYGPIEVVASLTTTTGGAPTATACTTKHSNNRGCTFKVVTYAPNPNTCPGLTTPSTPTPSTPHAHMPRPSTDRCSWSPNGRTILQVDNVDNPVLGKPVFKYYLEAPFNTAVTKTPLTPKTTTASTPTAAFATCTPPTTTPISGGTITHCAANNIQSIKVDLEVKTPGTQGKVESQTVTYQLSTVSKTYSPEVG